MRGSMKAASRPEVSWKTLPKKGQLFILTLSRLSEPVTQTSLSSYMYYQLKSFAPDASPSTIAAQAGWMQAAFTATQFLTAVPWGKAADSTMVGRKIVIMIGLLGTMLSVLGFGFSKSFVSAMVFRSIGGALNGNVGVMRTMISEMIQGREYQSRAFMIMPMTFNVGVIIGPMLGGLLSDPVGQYPALFGQHSWLGGTKGVQWMIKYPYALPNLVCGSFLLVAASAIWLGLDETHPSLQDSPDLGRRLCQWFSRHVYGSHNAKGYSLVSDADDSSSSVPTTPKLSRKVQEIPQRLPFHRIWTPNVISVFIAHGLMAMHVGTFNNLWFLFLSTPRLSQSKEKQRSLPFTFSGGFAMPPAKIGLALSIMGAIGIFIQLVIYPRVTLRFGVVKSYRFFLCFFPIAYFTAPFIALLPSSTLAPAQADGLYIWLGIIGVLAIQVSARTFALPGSTILVNNCCPHPSVLGTIHGIGQSVSAGMRTIGPAVCGWLYGKGLQWGIIGTAFWAITAVSTIGVIAGQFVREGNGHEIILDGEEDEALELPISPTQTMQRQRVAAR